MFKYSEEFDAGLVKSTGEYAVTVYYHKGFVTENMCRSAHICDDCWTNFIIQEGKTFLLTGNYFVLDDKSLHGQIFQVIDVESCKEMYLTSPTDPIYSIDGFLDYYAFELI